MKKIIVLVFFLTTCTLSLCEGLNGDISEHSFMEMGRTLVHGTVKRFMVILPAIFFKLGIAFTLLIVVTLAVVNNGVIGFLLLVVGLSNVLARVQDIGRRTALPGPFAYGPHPVLLQRKDDHNQETASGHQEGFMQGQIIHRDFTGFGKRL